jgi:glutamate synthase domain-containing protein 3
MSEVMDSARVVDLDATSVRELNQMLHDLREGDNRAQVRVANPRGKHAIACGLKVPADIEIAGHVGFYCAGMNQRARIAIDGHAGPGVAENMMSGEVRVTGNASQSAGATGHGGLLVIEGDASSRCGISMKGIDIVVGGSVGHLSAFMGQKGRLVICGDAGPDLGDSLYEARIYLRGKAEGLGADCVEKDMRDEHVAELRELLDRAGIDADPSEFRRYGSARKLYNMPVDHADAL